MFTEQFSKVRGQKIISEGYKRWWWMDDSVPQLPSKFLVQLVLIPICWFPFQCLNCENELYLRVFYFLTLFYSLLTQSSRHYAQQKWFLFRQRKIYGWDSWFQYFQFPNIGNSYHKFWISFQENPGTCAFFSLNSSLFLTSHVQDVVGV